jgi:hypothetical protein
MSRNLEVRDVLDRHQIRCPRCSCREAVVVLDQRFDVYWQCTDCEWRWPASEEESVLLLHSALKTIH